MEFLNKEEIILASKSPRRKELLEQVWINIKICPSDVNENIDLSCNPVEYVSELSFRKAESISLLYPDSWVLGADTIVVVKDQILGKPQSKSDAVRMLDKLNNCEHYVYTGFCLVNQTSNSVIKKFSETKVIFKELTGQEIDWYVNTGEPFDKAGAYAIQGKGAFLVKEISGSYSNVVGLPVCEVVETLKQLNIITFKDLNHYAKH